MSYVLERFGSVKEAARGRAVSTNHRFDLTHSPFVQALAE
jgi:hypothetical protein